MSGNAYYIPGETGSGPKLPSGEYEATITSLEMTENVKCGGFIADIFKPVYRVANSEYQNTDVRDNGVFRYKEKAGYNFKPSRNWGFAKFISIMQLRKDEGKGGQLPYLHLVDIKGAKVLIDVSMKTFMNDLDSEIRYPVARAIQLIETASVPF